MRKIKCKLKVSMYGDCIDCIKVKYKFDGVHFFYRSTEITKYDIWEEPTKNTHEYEVFDNINNEYIIKHISKLSLDKVKEICMRAIDGKYKTKDENNKKSNDRYDSIKKINNMEFEIELD